MELYPAPAVPVNPGQLFALPGTSFAEVYQMAAWLNTAFAAMDSGEPVCLATENRAVIAAALLAGLCGKTPLLLPHALSDHVLQQMQEETGFTAAVCDTGTKLSTAGQAKVNILTPERIRAESTAKSATLVTAPLPFTVTPDRELLRLFTGGSTGAPKIWSKSAANLLTEAAYLTNLFSITERDIIVATISPCHIYGLLFSVLVPLLSSATVLAATPSFPAEIATAVQENRATILAAVPVHYRAVRQQTVSKGSLRLAVSSAGMLDPEDNRIFCERNRTTITEVYGSTETGGIASRNRAEGEENFTPFAEVDWKIKGERLLVRSPYISEQAKRDADNFFLTGDRVTAVGNNAFQLLGRMDGITKVGGKRVDLAEIREIIRDQPEIADCFVLALAAAHGRENCIAALVQPVSPDRFNREALISSLQQELEPYALPRIIRTTEAIPMTGAGKYAVKTIREILSP